MPRGFLPRGLSNTCPRISLCRSRALRTGRCRTTLNDLSHLRKCLFGQERSFERGRSIHLIADIQGTLPSHDRLAAGDWAIVMLRNRRTVLAERSFSESSRSTAALLLIWSLHVLATESFRMKQLLDRN